jgi:predicted lipoprotein with Yx(FWY)xxD motif
LVSENEKRQQIGDWSVIKRDDGRAQWAYKSRPVYIRFHDIDPDSNSEKEGFHLLVP